MFWSHFPYKCLTFEGLKIKKNKILFKANTLNHIAEGKDITKVAVL